MENKAIGGQGIRIQTRRDGRREQLAALMYVKEMQERSWAHTMTLELRLGDKSDKSPTLMTIFCFLFSLFWYSSIRHGPAASTHLGGVAKRLIKIKNDFIIYFSSDNRGAACFVFTSLFTSISACRCRSLFVSLSAQSLCQCLYTSWSHSLSQSVSHPHPPSPSQLFTLLSHSPWRSIMYISLARKAGSQISLL